MTRPLASPVIIRPKHGAFKGVPLVAVVDRDNMCRNCIGGSSDDCKLARFSCYDIHYEHAEGGKNDKG